MSLRHGGDDAGHVRQSRGQRFERAGRGGLRENEAVGRGAQCRADHRTVVLDEPELVLGIELRPVAQRPCEPEDEVVPRLVGKQQRPCPFEPRRRVRSLDDLHRRTLSCLGNA